MQGANKWSELYNKADKRVNGIHVHSHKTVNLTWIPCCFRIHVQRVCMGLWVLSNGDMNNTQITNELNFCASDDYAN